MSKSLFLPTTVLEEAELEGFTTASEALGSRGAMEFVNSSLSTIQTFFSRMVQLDPAEDELFGETGRDVNGFRLTTEDEPAGVDHDTAISIRSDHVSALGIQSGKGSTSDALLCMGTWDGSEWGIHGELRVDMSDSNAFSMASNAGKISFDNNSTNRRLTADVYNLKIGNHVNGSGVSFYSEFQNLGSENLGLFFKNNTADAVDPDDAGATIYAKGGEIYRRKGDGTIAAWATDGGSGGFDTSDDYSVTGAWSFSPAAGTPDTLVPSFQPASAGPPFSLGTNAQTVNGNLVTHLNADYLDGKHGSYYAALSEDETVAGVYAFEPSSGTVPFTTNKTGVVVNLNADKVDGYSGSELAVLDEAETITGVYAFQPSSGTVPFTTNKTGRVDNLTAQFLGASPKDENYFAALSEDETVAGDWTFSGTPVFSGTPSFTNASAPFSVTSTNTVANLKAATAALADNATSLGGSVASAYTRHGNTETITAIWTYDTQLKLTDITAPTGLVPTGYGYLYNSGKKLYWRDEDENNHDLTSSNIAEALYEDTATSSNNTTVTLRSITPTLDKTYFVESYIVGRGTGGSFENGFVAIKVYATFYTNAGSTFVRLPDHSSTGNPRQAYDGAGSSIGFGTGNDKFTVDIIDDLDNIKVTIEGCSSGTGAGDYSWKAWTRVYNY